MNPSPTFHRRRFTDHAPLPGPVNPYAFCQHADPYCIECAPEGTLLLSNHDTESRSWWVGAPRDERKTFRAFCLIGALGLAMGVQAKLRDNPSHFIADAPAASAATRD